MSRSTVAKKSQESDEAAEFEKAVEQGVASLDKGRGISYEKIRRWLLSWGTENELPPPK
jgi:predicted transcriptional regulator